MPEGRPDATVTIVVVTYRRPGMFAEAMASFLRAEGVNNVVVVDNNPKGEAEYDRLVAQSAPARVEDGPPAAAKFGTVRRLSLADRAIHYIHTGRNLGGAGGFAVGAEYAWEHVRDTYCMFIDDDGEVTDGCINVLVEAAERTGAPFVAPVIFNTLSSSLELNQNKVDIDPTTLNETVVPLGAELKETPLVANGFVGVLCKTECVKAIGGVYAKFFILYDDADTTWRLSRRFGKGVLVPTARVLHKYAASSQRPYWKCVAEARSRIIFTRRNSGFAGRLLAVKSGLSLCVRNAPGFAVGIKACFEVLKTVIGIDGPFVPDRFISQVPP